MLHIERTNSEYPVLAAQSYEWLGFATQSRCRLKNIDPAEERANRIDGVDIYFSRRHPRSHLSGRLLGSGVDSRHGRLGARSMASTDHAVHDCSGYGDCVFLEPASAFILGIYIGISTLMTGSILAAYLIHVSVANGSEIVAICVNPSMRIVWKKS